MAACVYNILFRQDYNLLLYVALNGVSGVLLLAAILFIALDFPIRCFPSLCKIMYACVCLGLALDVAFFLLSLRAVLVNLKGSRVFARRGNNVVPDHEVQ